MMIWLNFLMKGFPSCINKAVKYGNLNMTKSLLQLKPYILPNYEGIQHAVHSGSIKAIKRVLKYKLQ